MLNCYCNQITLVKESYFSYLWSKSNSQLRKQISSCAIFWIISLDLPSKSLILSLCFPLFSFTDYVFLISSISFWLFLPDLPVLYLYALLLAYGCYSYVYFCEASFRILYHLFSGCKICQLCICCLSCSFFFLVCFVIFNSDFIFRDSCFLENPLYSRLWGVLSNDFTFASARTLSFHQF